MIPRSTPRRVRVLAAPVAVFLLLCPAIRADVDVTTLARLGGEPDGYHSKAALVAGPGGFLYGTTEAGGPANCGTIYKVAPGGAVTTIYSFTGGSDGSNPMTSLTLAKDGDFYGTTPAPGGLYSDSSANVGTVFRVTPAGKLTTLHTFSALKAPYLNAEGGDPLAALTVGPGGDLYGTTTTGGKNGTGTIFKMTPAGDLTVVYAFSGGKYFTQIRGLNTGLTLGDDGNFYGTAGGGAHASGVVYRVSPAGDFKVIATFPNLGDDNAYAPSGLIKGSDGAFYGTTQDGGAHSEGTAFRVTSAGALTFLHSFSGTVDGEYPVGNLIEGNDHNFYGVTSDGGPGSGYGTVFQMTRAGAVKVLYTFTYTEYQGTLAGANPQAGLFQDGNGDLYGTTGFGNIGDTDEPNMGPGTVFKITTAGALTTLHGFISGGYNSVCALTEIGGNYFGITQAGGALGGGTVFAVAPDGAQATVHNFDPATEGRGSNSSLTLDGAGNVFGATAQGGSGGGGTVFQLVPKSASANTEASKEPGRAGPQPQDFVSDVLYFYVLLGVIDSEEADDLYDFFNLIVALGTDSSPADRPRPLQVQSASPDVFYGVAARSGASGDGGIVSFTQGDSALEHPYDFGSQPNDGRFPVGLVVGTDGSFYGVTTYGGASDLGTIFKYTPGAPPMTLYTFQGKGDGAYPMGGVVFGSDGNLYGTTSAANASDYAGLGTVFRLAQNGSGFKVLHTFTGSTKNPEDGASAAAALLLAHDGTLYGTTNLGGQAGPNGSGTIFSISPTGAYQLLYSFSFLDGGGSYPQSALIEGSDGNLYGTTSGGGTDNGGVVYEVNLQGSPTPTVTAIDSGDGEAVEGGADGKIIVRRTGGDTKALTVRYAVGGSAKAGVDYAALPGKVTIAAGAAEASILVKPLTAEKVAGTRIVKITLLAGTGYQLGSPDAAKIKVVDH
jgi:uncharacterized repeat protein (TIGR03803 family)